MNEYIHDEQMILPPVDQEVPQDKIQFILYS